MTNLVNFDGCVDKFKFLFWTSLPQEDGKEHKKELAEQLGDLGMYPITTAIPGAAQAAWQFCTAPKVLVVVAGTIGIGGLTYLTFPEGFISVAGELIRNIPSSPVAITAERAKVAAFTWGVETITALTARTYGRFSNTLCVKRYWNSEAKPDLPPKSKGENEVK